MSASTDPDSVEVMVIIVSLLAAGFFAAAETAIGSLGTLKAKQLLDSNPSPQRPLGLWLAHPGRVLTTIQLYSSVCTTLAVALTTHLAMRHVDVHPIATATIAATLLVLVFGKVIPKSFAKAHHETFALPFLRIVYAIYLVSYPVVWAFAGLAGRLISLIGGKADEKPPITEEELEYLVDVGERAGVLEETKKEMIEGVFEFDETKVREIMTPRPDIKYLRVDESYDDALRLAIETGMSRIPVCDEDGIDHVIGILLVKDLLRVARAHNGSKQAFSLRGVMREPFFVPESKLIMDVFKDLKSTKNHIAIVIDEHGGTAGLVTMEDILEEIVGEIQDEYDVEEAEIIELEPGIYDVAGSYNIDEFLEYFEIENAQLTEERGEDVDTIAGWITSLVGDLPEVGKTVRIGPLNVEVSDVERRRIRRVRVSRVLSEGEAQPSEA
jgi:CBS domain containing-hemolysin-like protein